MSESDRELLELAAKAAGYKFTHAWSDKFAVGDTKDDLDLWNPLRDDGDALRLAVKLGLDIGICIDMPLFDYSFARADRIKAVMENHQNEPGAATRRAIVRAAAEIGKS